MQEKAIEMAESGHFKNAHAIRQRLINCKYGVLVGEAIPDESMGLNFTDRLDHMCKQYFREGE